MPLHSAVDGPIGRLPGPEETKSRKMFQEKSKGRGWCAVLITWEEKQKYSGGSSEYFRVILHHIVMEI